MAKTSKRYPTYTTPRGVLLFPHLNKPRDYKGNQKFAYDTSFILEGEEADALRKQVDELMDQSAREHANKLADPPYRQHTGENEHPVEGAFEFRFKISAEIKTKSGEIWHRKPAIFDRFGVPITDRHVGSGTTAQIKYQAYFWNTGRECGVTLQPVALMVFDLIEEGSHRSARDWGFDVQEPSPVPATDEGGSQGDEDEASIEVPF